MNMLRITYLAAFLPFLLLLGCAAGPAPYGPAPYGPAPYVASEVDVYRAGPDPTLVALCDQLQKDADQASIHNRSEVEEYTNKTASGDEYSRQSVETCRYSQTAKDRDDMLVLCTQIR